MYTSISINSLIRSLSVHLYTYIKEPGVGGIYIRVQLDTPMSPKARLYVGGGDNINILFTKGTFNNVYKKTQCI